MLGSWTTPPIVKARQGGGGLAYSLPAHPGANAGLWRPFCRSAVYGLAWREPEWNPAVEKPDRGLAPRPGLEPGTLRLTVARPLLAMDCDTLRLCSIHAPSVKIEPLSGLGWFATVFDRGVHPNGNQVSCPEIVQRGTEDDLLCLLDASLSHSPNAYHILNPA